MNITLSSKVPLLKKTYKLKLITFKMTMDRAFLLLINEILSM